MAKMKNALPQKMESKMTGSKKGMAMKVGKPMVAKNKPDNDKVKGGSSKAKKFA